MKETNRLSLVLTIISVLIINTNGDDPGIPPSNSSKRAYASGQVNCFVCEAWGDASCNLKTTTASATPSENCLKPNELAKQFVQSVSAKLKGAIGDIDLTALTTNIGNEVEKQGELEDMPGCAFFYASTENTFTKGIDNLLQKTRSIFGDSNSDQSVAVQQYTRRDCVTVRTRKEMRNEADRCVTIPGVGNIFTLLLCTCTKDKCNDGAESPYLKGLISTAVGSDSGQMSNQYNKKFLISTTLLSAYIIHRFY